MSDERVRIGAKVYVVAEGVVTAATAHRVSVDWSPPLDGGTVHVVTGEAYGASKEPLPPSAYDGDPVALAYAAGRAEGARSMRARAAAVARVGGALVCNAYAGMSERDCGRDDAAESIADHIEALPLDEATS